LFIPGGNRHLPSVSRFVFALVLSVCCAYAQKSGSDPLDRLNPRSTVTAFLESCHQNNYQRASQYLDTRQLPAKTREQQGIELAKELESLLNADAQFDPLKLSQSQEGNLTDDSDQSMEGVATISKGDQNFQLKLQRVQISPTTEVWLFSAGTVALIPKLAPLPSTESAIEARLPRFLVSFEISETPLWKWIALLIAAGLIIALFRVTAALSLRLMPGPRWRFVHALLEPVLVFIAAALFRVIDELLRPSALTRLYLADFLLLVVVGAVAWALMNLVELFLARVDAVLDPRQRVVSHSLIYLGRRTSRVVIFVLAAIFVLNNWGYPMNTIIAGLGVSGIAVALAAQQTIANVFGGVSVIGDHPVMVGDLGNFGGVIGTVDDIGMRSTRIRTLSRTVVSIPNSAFAGMNLENYSLRDKILFNPALSVKRTTPKAQIEELVTALGKALREDKRVEAVPATARITAITAAAFTIEIFCYVLTADIDDFHKIASELYLGIDGVVTSAGVELV
jgi:MscS family membrane protein